MGLGLQQDAQVHTPTDHLSSSFHQAARREACVRTSWVEDDSKETLSQTCVRATSCCSPVHLGDSLQAAELSILPQQRLHSLQDLPGVHGPPCHIWKTRIKSLIHMATRHGCNIVSSMNSKYLEGIDGLFLEGTFCLPNGKGSYASQKHTQPIGRSSDFFCSKKFPTRNCHTRQTTIWQAQIPLTTETESAQPNNMVQRTDALHSNQELEQADMSHPDRQTDESFEHQARRHKHGQFGAMATHTWLLTGSSVPLLQRHVAPAARPPEQLLPRLHPLGAVQQTSRGPSLGLTWRGDWSHDEWCNTLYSSSFSLRGSSDHRTQLHATDIQHVTHSLVLFNFSLNGSPNHKVNEYDVFIALTMMYYYMYWIKTQKRQKSWNVKVWLE